jgi:hypothetical protein
MPQSADPVPVVAVRIGGVEQVTEAVSGVLVVDLDHGIIRVVNAVDGHDDARSTGPVQLVEGVPLRRDSATIPSEFFFEKLGHRARPIRVQRGELRPNGVTC